jgi:hypothetical protein
MFGNLEISVLLNRNTDTRKFYYWNFQEYRISENVPYPNFRNGPTLTDPISDLEIKEFNCQNPVEL